MWCRLAGVSLCVVACGGEGALEPSPPAGRPTSPDALWPTPVLGETRQIAPGQGMPPEYVAEHGLSNNNLDVVRHEGRVFLAIRNGEFHFASPDTRLYVFSSVDEQTWDFEAKLELDRDVREPRFLSLGGRLFLYFALLGRDRFDFEPGGMRVVERLGPRQWTAPEGFYRPEEGYIPWRVRMLGERPVMLAYNHGEHEYDLSGLPIEIELLTTDDGRAWRPLDPARPVVSRGGGSETDVALDDRGDLYAVIRNEAGDASGWGSKLCYAPRDRLAEWTCKHDPRKYDSPWVFARGGAIFVIGRRNVTDDGDFELTPGAPWSGAETFSNLARYSGQPKRCALWQLERSTLTMHHLIDLPSRGDTCFASVLDDPTTPGRMFVYDYSSPLEPGLPELSWSAGQLGPTNIYRTVVDLSPPR